MVKASIATSTMRLVRSKLRKREEPLTSTPTNLILKEDNEKGFEYKSLENFRETDSRNTNTCSTLMKDQHHVTFLRTSGVTGSAVDHTNVSDIDKWIFPPKAPAPHIYHTEMLATNEKISFKGFRKQFSGRFKRLVARKPEPAPVIPPELKPQLKTIYVY